MLRKKVSERNEAVETALFTSLPRILKLVLAVDALPEHTDPYHIPPLILRNKFKFVVSSGSVIHHEGYVENLAQIESKGTPALASTARLSVDRA